MAARKHLMQRCVAAVPASRVFDLAGQSWRVPNGWSKPVFRPSLRHLQCRLNHKHRRWVLVNVKTYNIVDKFRLADLGGSHCAV